MPNLLPLILISTIWLGAFLTAATPFVVLETQSLAVKYLCLASFPFLFFASFILISGAMSLLGQKGIIQGTFPRKPFDKIYLRRRIFGACWTQVFYFKPLYGVALTIPILKKILFRLFGYRHQTQFTLYPDTWIRDLPLLKFGEGAYLANRATIGTNICLSNGSILVDSIEVDTKGLVGHLAVLAPGVKIGKYAEVGVSATIAIRTKLCDGSKVHPCCMINHGAVIGEETKVGTMSYIGIKAVLGPKLNIPAGTNLPSGTIIQTQDEMQNFFRAETKQIDEHVGNLRKLFEENIGHGFKV